MDETRRLWVEERMSLRKISNLAGITPPAVRKRLISMGVDTTKATGLWIELKCPQCKKKFKRVRCQVAKSKYCSDKCYHAKLGQNNYKPNRHGQRTARKNVSQYFKLKKGHIVHHVDGNNLNNKMHNLWVFMSQSDHLRWHRRGEEAGVKPIWTYNMYLKKQGF